MAFFNGAGGAGDATTDSTSQAIAAVEAAAQAEASALSAANSATSAAASASTATSSSNTASSAADAALSHASTAATSAASAGLSATAATEQATLAATSAIDSSTFATSSLGYANLAKDWANKTDSAVAGGEYSAKYYANSASTSATNASTSASDAATSASDAAQSAIDAAAVIPSQTGNAGKYLTTDGTDTSWADVTAGGTGTVTSVALSAPTGLTVSGSPITSSGTLALSYDSGYAIPTTAKQTEWDTAYGWGNHASAGYLSSSSVIDNLSDVVITSPSNGQVLKYNGTNWVNDTDATGGGGGGSGTVTSVAMTVPTGLSVSGSPITTSGTLAVTLTSGYSIPTTTSQTNWDTAYGWGDHASAGYLTTSSAASTYQPLDADLTAIAGLAGTSGLLKKTAANTWSLDTNTYLTSAVTSVTGTSPISSSGGNTPAISISQATTSTNGYLSSTDWNTFNGKQATLVSGTNIKTINGSSVLGSGDLAVSGMTYPEAGIAVSTGSAWGTSLTAPSGTIVGTTDTQTLTNKRVTPRVSTTTSSATPTINTDNVDIYGLTAQAVNITSFTTNLSGTPTNGQKLQIYIVGTAARTITWGSSFESSTVSLPTTTVGTARLDIGFVWNAATSKWRCVAVA